MTMGNYATYSSLGKNGRLCNAIFQTLGTAAYALDNKKEFIFPKWEYRKYFLQELPEGYPIIDVKIPVEFHYAPIQDYPNKNVNLHNGQLQSWRYFAHRWAELEPFFTLKDELHYYIWQKYGTFLSENNCGIHVRRTDYTTPINLEYHGVMPIPYYKEGVNRLYGTSNPTDILFIICSDDITWCKTNFSFPNQIFIEGEKDIIDLYILMYCRNLIIANSTYSLFPATVNTIKNSNYKVVAPRNWFGAKCSQKTSDIYMPSWIKI